MDQPWLYIVLAGTVLIVYGILLPNKAKNSYSEKMAKEMEEAIDLYAAEMEEQNQALIQLFGETKKEYEQQLSVLTSRLDLLDQRQFQLQQERPGQAGPPQAAMKLDVMYGQTDGQIGTASLLGTAGVYAPSQIRNQAAKAAEAMKLAYSEESLQPAQEVVPALTKIEDRYAALFEMHHQGKSIEVIAKKLGMNKGEVNLIIQLAKQEDGSHA